MPSEPAGAPVALPRLPAGLWWHTTALLAACLGAVLPALALAPLLPGSGVWIAAAMTAAAYPVARTGVTWQPRRAQCWAVTAALLLGLFLAFMARALAPYLPGITIPALAAEIGTFGVLWGLYHAHAPARLAPPARIAASVLAAPLLVYLFALLLSRYLGLDYLQLAQAGTGLAGLLLDGAVCTFVAVQVTRQAQLLAALPAPPGRRRCLARRVRPARLPGWVLWGRCRPPDCAQLAPYRAQGCCAALLLRRPRAALPSCCAALLLRCPPAALPFPCATCFPYAVGSCHSARRSSRLAKRPVSAILEETRHSPGIST